MFVSSFELIWFLIPASTHSFGKSLMTCCSYASAEFVGHSLILTDSAGNTTNLNLVLAEVRIIGSGFSVRSIISGSKFIPNDNELLGPGTPLTYAMVRAAITAVTA